MTKDSERQNQSSPASRGGAGVYIEGELGAYYLLAMLAGTEGRGMPGAQVNRVHFQGAELGFTMDDLIIEGISSAGKSLLEIQSKRNISFSPHDPTFVDIAVQIARSKLRDVPENRHLLAVATQRQSKSICGPYQDVLMWARSVETGQEFFERVAAKNVASGPMRTFVGTFRANLLASGVVDDDETIWKLLRRFSILVFDFESVAPLARLLASMLARQVLADEQVTMDESLWANLIEVSIAIGKVGGSINREGLQAKLSGRGFRFAADRDYTTARTRLADLARMTLAGIETTVGGFNLTRHAAVASLNEALDSHRFIQLTGGPGVGKSGVLKLFAERASQEASLIVLDPISTPSGGWTALSQRLGIPGSARAFLNDLAASGGSVIVIDSLEMFSEATGRRTINELLREAASIPGVRVVVTSRYSDDPTTRWIADDVLVAFEGIYQVPVSELSDEEVGILSESTPELRAILAPGHPAAKIARNLYRLARLLKVPKSMDIRTEAALASQWWSTADNFTSGSVRAAQRILADLARVNLAGEYALEFRQDSDAHSHLIRSQTLYEVTRDHFVFYHDVLRDWAIGNLLHEDYKLISDIDLAVPASARVARGIEFAARLALESSSDDESWLRLLDRLSWVGAHCSWRRQALLAIVRSEISHELLERGSKTLLAKGGALFAELVTVIAATDTMLVADFYTSLGLEIDKPISKTLRANASGTGIVLLNWLLTHSKELPQQAISAAVKLVKIQFHLFQAFPNVASKTAAMLFYWLRQLDIREAATTIPNDVAAEPLERSARQRMIEDVRTMALLLSAYSPDNAKAYLGEIDGERDDYQVKAIRQFGSVLALVAPAELADLVSSSLIEQPRRGRSSFGTSNRRAFGFADSDYLPPSPAQPPFFDLLVASPEHGLALVRRLISVAVEFHASGADSSQNGFTVVFDSGPRFFPYTETYFWSRNQAHEYAVASGLKALEAWGHQRLDAGEHIDTVLADILGPDGGCAAYLLVAVDILLAQFPVTRSALVPFLANPELLATERTRYGLDQLDRKTFNCGDEPHGKVTLEHLRMKPSRKTSLEYALPAFLSKDEDAEKLRNRLRAAVAELDPFEDHSDFADPRFMGRYALNLINPQNWVPVESGRAYQPPSNEAKHLKRLHAERDRMVRHSEIDARIRLAIDRIEHATPDTARDAAEFAGGELPDDTDTDSLKSRSTRLIATALLVARDGHDDLLDQHEAWVRKVIGLAFGEESDRFSGSSDNLQFNRPALGALALLHLWRRRNRTADREALVLIATRRDQACTPAFVVGLQVIMEKDARLLKAAMRAAFAGCVWRRHPHDEDGAVKKRFNKKRKATITAAVLAENAWLDGGSEPAWPGFPNEKPIVPTQSRVQVPGKVPPALGAGSVEEADDDSAAVHADSQTAAKWLEMLSSPVAKCIGWDDEVVKTYSSWSAKINGGGLPNGTKLDRLPKEWNAQFYALFAKVLLDQKHDQFDNMISHLVNFPDQSFADVAVTLLHAADVLYFNNASRQPQLAVELRARIAVRTITLQRWRSNNSPGDLSIDYDTGGVVAKLFLNTHDPFNGTHSYLVPAVADRLDPLLEPMRQLLPGGPTSFVALCTMNMLLVAPRARHLDFLLAAVDAWFDRLPSDTGLWITIGVGQKITKWFEAAAQEEPGLLEPTHPKRARIDRVFGQLVAVGVAEAHDLERQVETASS